MLMQNPTNIILSLLLGVNSFILPKNYNYYNNFNTPIMSSQEYLKNTINAPKNNNVNDYQKKYTYSPNLPTLLQGGSLKTWSYKSPLVEQVQIVLSSEGRPIDSDIELWHGPDNTPYKMRVYIENAQLRPFTAILETPRGPNTIAIKNIGQLEFPITTHVISENIESPSSNTLSSGNTIQGGALRTYPFNPFVDSVEVFLKTDGRPLNARIELLQGPNNNKQVIELYTEDGCDRPFFCILETPGSGNVVRVVNTAPIEFPMTASVLPCTLSYNRSSNPDLGGDIATGQYMNW